MNPEQVKERLDKLHECSKPFTVVFSGKKSGSVNGLYKFDSGVIIINNRNFGADETGDNLMFYTAMHELAHHIHITEYGQKGARCHTKLFHAILDDLADKAEELGFYRMRMPGNNELDGLIFQAKTIIRSITRMYRELGVVLKKLNDVCAEGARFEDVVKRGIGITLETAKKAAIMARLDLPESIGFDIQEAIAGERDEDKRKAMAAAAQAGKSAAQVKCAGRAPTVRGNESNTETENLLLEKTRLEKNISELQKRLRDVMRRLNTPGGFSASGAARAPCTAEGAA